MRKSLLISVYRPPWAWCSSTGSKPDGGPEASPCRANRRSDRAGGATGTGDLMGAATTAAAVASSTAAMATPASPSTVPPRWPRNVRRRRRGVQQRLHRRLPVLQPLRCTGGRWQSQEVAPAPCFACGPTLRCQTNAQYCHVLEAERSPIRRCISVAPPGDLPAHPHLHLPAQQGLAETVCSRATQGRAR